MSRVETVTETHTATRGSSGGGALALRGGTHALQRNHSLDKWSSFQNTPILGTEFDQELQLSKVLAAPNADELVKDLAILVAQRNVVFFRKQDLSIEDQTKLGEKLGRLSGKPAESTLHIHPTTEDTSPKGDQVTIITSDRRDAYLKGDPSRIASTGWHSDITFEKVPSDYAILKIHTNPESGGDTLWASAYELYDRLSPPFAQFLEGLSAIHDANKFHEIGKNIGIKVRDEARGNPANVGPDFSATHPVIRVNPVTGWKGVFVNRTFTKRIVGVTKDESDRILGYLNDLVSENHDLQVRFKWSAGNAPGIGDIAIWDNRSSQHTATWDYSTALRVGDRVVSIGEKPYYDGQSGRSRREAIGAQSWHSDRA